MPLKTGRTRRRRRLSGGLWTSAQSCAAVAARLPNLAIGREERRGGDMRLLSRHNMVGPGAF